MTRPGYRRPRAVTGTPSLENTGMAPLLRISKGWAEAPERDDPTVDNMRMITSALVEEVCKDPSAKKPKSKTEYVPQMMILF